MSYILVDYVHDVGKDHLVHCLILEVVVVPHSGFVGGLHLEPLRVAAH
jgi:hypothetical protein